MTRYTATDVTSSVPVAGRVHFDRKREETKMRGNHMIVLLLGAALLASGCAATKGTSPKGAELPIEKAAIQFATDVKEGGYKVIGAEELSKLRQDKPDLLLIDTMPAAAYAACRIPGAVNAVVPMKESELTPEGKKALLDAAGPDKAKTIVTYCGFVSCRRSHVAAKTLVENGYSDVLRLPGGIVGWREGGYPVEK